MIKLTDYYNDTPVYVNPDAIKFIYPDGEHARIAMIDRDDPLDVTESPEEVARKVLEYQTQLLKFSAAHQTDSNDDIHDSYEYLKRLAGLETDQ